MAKATGDIGTFGIFLLRFVYTLISEMGMGQQDWDIGDMFGGLVLGFTQTAKRRDGRHIFKCE